MTYSVSTVTAARKGLFYSAAEAVTHASPGCSIGALERVLDAYALGEMPEAITQSSVQAHFRTCEYCARLLGVAEEIRAARRSALRLIR
jgi:hypothetical protein